MSSKKGSKAPEPEAKYQVRDIVLAKVRGYPPWPAMIVDPEAVGKAVKKERPVSKKTTFYCVRFFPAGDHSWAVAKDISRLLPHEIEAYITEPSKKNGDLKRGYEIALDPTAWEKEHEERQAQVEAADEEEEEGVDQLDESDGGEDEVDNEGGSKKKKANKKRKRDSAASAEDLKKKRKSNQEALSAKRRPVAGGKKGAKGKAGSADNVESEDGDKADDDAGEKKSSKRGSKSKAADAEERASKKAKKDKEDVDDAEDAALLNDPEAQRVKEWRHKLQRAFLTAKSPPQPDDMPQYDQIFSTVENYDKLTIDYLQFSKIGKVMRRIAGMETIPRDDEFHFKDRASKLVATWQGIIQAAEAEAETNGKANGVSGKKEEAEAEVNGKPEATQDAEMASGDASVKDAPTTNGVTEAATTEAKDDEEAAMDTSDS